MATVLNSWKSIAQYMGSSVRTVERWTAERGFPVRGDKRIVVATTEEIDEWVLSQSPHCPRCNDSKAEYERKIAALESEIKALRLKNGVMEMKGAKMQANGRATKHFKLEKRRGLKR